MDAKPMPEQPVMPEGVSIHAPVMDANADLNVFAAAQRVSIHAPVMDAKTC